MSALYPVLARNVVWPFWAVTVGLTLATRLLPQSPGSAFLQWLPWILSIVALGVPHGSQDYELLSLQSRKQPGTWIGFTLLYILGAGVVLLIWRLNPLSALVGFLILSGFHFGEGDVSWSATFGPALALRSRVYRSVLLVLRSALPILLPLVVFPQQFAAATSLLPGIGTENQPLVSQQALFAIAVALGLLIAVQFGLLFSAARKDARLRASAIVEGTDTAMLVLLFVTVPPIASIGTYFLLFHSHRYVARRIALANPELLLGTDSNYWRSIWQFHRKTLLVSAGIVATLPALWLALRQGYWSVAQVGPSLLVALSALTLPHALLVWYDSHRTARRAAA